MGRSGYVFQGKWFAPVGELEAALNAQQGQRIIVSVSSCASDDRVAAVVRLVGQRQTNVAMSRFEEPCQ